MHQQGRGAIEIDACRILQQGAAALPGKLFTEQKVAVAMHHEQRRARINARPDPPDHLEVQRTGIIITDPGLEQVTENINGVRIPGACCHKPEE